MNVDKLRNCFDEMVVYKDLKKSNFFNSLSLPSFMRDWILKKFEDEDGSFDTEKVAAFVKKYLPKKDDWNSIKLNMNKLNFWLKYQLISILKPVGCLFPYQILDFQVKIR